MRSGGWDGLKQRSTFTCNAYDSTSFWRIRQVQAQVKKAKARMLMSALRLVLRRSGKQKFNRIRAGQQFCSFYESCNPSS